jgi:predicted DNA repair protein MutK
VSIGLLALLDDVAALTRVAAASLDDVAGQAMKAGTKAAGVVIDDAAVTPGFVQGFAASRELPIVGRIALGSLRNKLVFLLPGALLLGAFAPWAITPLLMLGGAYLCFEGAEKVAHSLSHAEAHGGAVPVVDEAARIRSAIQTDLILSAEIMAITLGTVSDSASWIQAIVLAITGTVLTVLVYGAVALIVKADDLGLLLAKRPGRLLRALGRGMVIGVPRLMRVLTVVGTAAMLWVGGGILVHGLETLGVHAPAALLHRMAAAAGPAAWFVTAGGSGIVGLLTGVVLLPVGWLVARLRS